MDTWLITGGAGFIGCNFVRLALARSRARVVVFDKLTYAGNPESLADVCGDPRFTFIQADIADRDAVTTAYREYQPTAVLNFAAETHVDRSIDGPAEFVRTNVVGTFELLEAARHYTAELDRAARESFRFLHVSTDEVYGSLGSTGAFHETTPYEPNSPYSASKAGADHLVRAYHETYGLPAVITNCSNNYGPYQFPEKLIPLMGILLALTEGRPGRKYNIGGFGERTNLEIIDTLCAELERVRPAASNPALARAGVGAYAELKQFVTDRPGHDRRYAIDSRRAQNELSWRPDHDLATGLGATVRWYLDHRDWCEAVQSGRYRRERLGLSSGSG
jgi:dTDP-glucose 4,6-dehydratase